MTADQKKPKSFERALQYNLAKVSKGVAEVLDRSFSEVSEKFIMKEIDMMRTKRPDLKKFFYHTSINFPLHEDLSNKVMKQIANDYLKLNGFIQHQFIVFRHYDAGHPHLHILVNRIGFDEKVVSDSNDYARSEKVLRALEIKYKLTQVSSSKQAKKRAATKNELEMVKRTGEPSHKLKMQELIKEVLNVKSKLSSSDFVKALEKKGVNVRFNQASTGYISGISYSYNGMTITGSKLGNDFKWTTIKNRIDYRKEKNNTTVQSIRKDDHRKDRPQLDGLVDKPEGHTKNEISSVNREFDSGHDFHFDSESGLTGIGRLWDELTRTYSMPEMNAPQNQGGRRKRKRRRR